MSVLQGYLKTALRKKQLIASFIEQFKLNLENKSFIDFQFYVAKLSQQRCFIQSDYYTRLYAGCFTKEAIDSFSLMLLNLIKIRYSTFSYCYTDLGAGYTESSKGFERKPFRVLLILKNHRSFKNSRESLLSKL